MGLSEIFKALFVAFIVAWLFYGLKVTNVPLLKQWIGEFVPFAFMFIFLFYIQHIVGEIKSIKRMVEELRKNKGLS